VDPAQRAGELSRGAGVGVRGALVVPAADRDGQHFGGKSVSMLGIAGVGVAPEARGRGSARWMMSLAMQEAQADGFALSTLFASTQGLYRQVGYEQAGYRCQIKLLPHRIDVRAREPHVRPLTPEDEPAIQACYKAFAGEFAGMLDRGPYIWRRIKEFRDKSYHGFGLCRRAATSRGTCTSCRHARRTGSRSKSRILRF